MSENSSPAPVPVPPATPKTLPHLFSDMPAHRVVALLSLYVVAFLMSVGLFLIPLYQVVMFLLGHSTWGFSRGMGVVLPLFLAVVSTGYGLRWIFLMVMIAMNYWRDYRHPCPLPDYWPFVSIFLPAHNEGDQIEGALEAFSVMDYPRFEVIVVDDGSKDDTYDKAKRFEGNYVWGTIKVVKKPNGGKWSALNLAYQLSSGEIILTADADGRVDHDALKRMVARLMADQRIVAVSGYTRVMNRTNLLTHCQTLEFVMWSGALRIPQSLTGTVLCLPGPLSLFRRSALEEVHKKFGVLQGEQKEGVYDGPFEGSTFAEDFDVTIALLQLGGRIEYDPLAGCDTDAPEDVFTLINQRYRWARGSMQVIVKYFSRMKIFGLSGHFKLFSWLMSSYVYDMALYMFGVGAQIAVFVLALSGMQGALTMLLAFLGYQFVFRLVIGSIMITTHRESFKPLHAIPFLDMYGSFLLGGAFIISVLDELFKSRMRW
ncbi:MAG: glycosyltransferase family 2 protein [Planctomycetes bacterium]|nr:glycosyltransferase family 2 protein [Planctomycetota bacterium]